jgi:hypothetical protein
MTVPRQLRAEEQKGVHVRACARACVCLHVCVYVHMYVCVRPTGQKACRVPVVSTHFFPFWTSRVRILAPRPAVLWFHVVFLSSSSPVTLQYSDWVRTASFYIPSHSLFLNLPIVGRYWSELLKRHQVNKYIDKRTVPRWYWHCSNARDSHSSHYMGPAIVALIFCVLPQVDESLHLISEPSLPLSTLTVKSSLSAPWRHIERGKVQLHAFLISAIGWRGLFILNSHYLASFLTCQHYCPNIIN